MLNGNGDDGLYKCKKTGIRNGEKQTEQLHKIELNFNKGIRRYNWIIHLV